MPPVLSTQPARAGECSEKSRCSLCLLYHRHGNIVTVTGVFRSPRMTRLKALLCYGDGSRSQHTGVAISNTRRYCDTVPVMFVLIPMLTSLSNRKPSLRIATAEKRLSGVLAAEMLQIVTPAALVTVRVSISVI